ncbi:MAG: lysophospholipid acyltransferase family protein [Patescibacteria group bacterium]|nr:lysophospholipid acyltransferase family protein [Patescibacteria group bacterium]
MPRIFLWPCWLLARAEWFVLAWAQWFLTRTQVKGIENIPKKGGVIIASNHMGSFDGFFLGAVILKLRKEKIYFVVEERVKPFLPTPKLEFKFKWFGLLLKRHKTDSSVLLSAQQVLQQGFSLVIFFEGKRRLNELPRPRTGVVQLQCLTGMSIVPVWIKSFTNWSFLEGTRRFLSLFVRKIQIVFGSPLKNILGEETEKAKILLRKRERSDELHQLLRKGAQMVQEEVQKLALV